MAQKKIYITLALMIFVCFSANSQESGSRTEEIPTDTVFVFDSPRQLAVPEEDDGLYKNAWGLDLLFSESGFGVGLFSQKTLTNDLFIFSSLYISGARNTDEFEYYNYETGETFVPNKVNRLFNMPLTLGLQKNFFADDLYQTFRPYLNAGIGYSLIISTPYSKEFFNSFSYADFYGRFGGFIGAGANFGSSAKTLMGVNIRYYYIPFGDSGLESIKDLPIKNFGGIFISFTFGFKDMF